MAYRYVARVSYMKRRSIIDGGGVYGFTHPQERALEIDPRLTRAFSARKAPHGRYDDIGGVCGFLKPAQDAGLHTTVTDTSSVRLIPILDPTEIRRAVCVCGQGLSVKFPG